MVDTLPVFYIPHGGGPWPFVELPGVTVAENQSLIDYLRGIPDRLPQPPTQLLVVSAHWECSLPTVMAGPHPDLYYDYYNFPPAAYELDWPAPGAPELAARARELLESAGFASTDDKRRGFDHGTFIPMKVCFPAANIPTTQLSLIKGLDPHEHIRLGQALEPLRTEGVLIICSGMSYHDLHGFFDGAGVQASQPFDAWLQEKVPTSAAKRNAHLMQWREAPGARRAHPREEHLLPLMVAAGAAGKGIAVLDFNGTFCGASISAFRFD